MSPSQQRSISVGNIVDCVSTPLIERHVTHVSCDHLDPAHVTRGRGHRGPPPPPPPRLSSLPLTQLRRAPSQALMHHTTVPQSLVTRALGSRHAPTRSSLRHSRMLVLLRQGTVPRKYLPGVLSRSLHGLVVCTAQLVIGSVLVSLAIWRMVLQAQMVLVWDWPLYSGVATLCSGWAGLWLVACCRYYYPPYSVSTPACVFPINTASILISLGVSLVACVFSLVSSISHALHLITLASASCAPPLSSPASWPAQSCLCLSETRLWRRGELVYPGLSCDELTGTQPPLLVSLIILNIMGLICSLAYMMLLACSKHNVTFRNWRSIRKSETPQRNVR